ncbi:MAG: molybdopterin-guanine dinucleotide biosynthesis protein [Enterovirga sp.]|nr:molybdopterin-guanine dinucleotide biosynthesis protein [Enterovirga sp.]
MSGEADEAVASAPGPAERLTVGVVVAKRRLSGPWATHAWLPVGILPAPADVSPWTPLSDDGREQLFYAGAFEIALHRSETSHYRDNLASGRPSLWVGLRPLGEDRHEIATVTPDPYEGESMAEGIGEIVEAVPMPERVQAEIAAFVEAFHVDRAFVKRKRDRADREALARGERGSRRDVPS